MKSYVLIWAFLLWLPFQLFSQNADYRLEMEVLIADENSDLFIPMETYTYSLAPQNYRQPVMLPSTAGRIRLQMYLMSGAGKVDMHDLLVNGVKSSDQESFIIENPLAWIQRAEPLMIVLADKPYSYYKLNIPIQWSDVSSRTPQAFNTTPRNYSAPQSYATPQSYSAPAATTVSPYQTAYIPPGYAVQLEARKDQPTLEKFTDLMPFGTVYYREDPSWYRVRVGTYNTREEALQARNVIRKVDNGAFGKAFLISEDGGYVIQLPNTGVGTTGAVPQDYSAGTSGRINTQARTGADLTARGGAAAQPTPQSYAAPAQPTRSPEPTTLAERAPKFPDWYYNNTTTTPSAPEPGPASYEAIINSPLPKSYDAAGDLTPKGVPQPGWYVQAGAFGEYANAQRFLQKLFDQGVTNAQIIETRKDNGNLLYKTWIGPYRTQATANNQRQLMARDMKISGTVVSGN